MNTPRLPRAAPLLLSLATLLLSACAVGPKYEVPKDSVFARQQEHAVRFDGQDSSAVATARPAVEDAWWKLYDDPKLDALIAQALHANTELRVATARLELAQSRYEQARAAGELDVGAEAAVARGQISGESLLLTEAIPTYNLVNAEVSASYQLDLFGQLRRGVEAAQANSEAAQAAADLAKITLIAKVIGAYAAIGNANHELEVVRHGIDLQRKSRDLSARLFDAGRGTRTAVERSDAQIATLQASLPPIEATKQAAGYELAALLGLPPDQVPADVMQLAKAPTLKHPIPVGDGAALLRRRPDVRRAERELAASTAEIGVATAALYPDIRLGAALGSLGLLDDFAKPATREWSIGPLISWSIPNRGARERVAAAKAGAKVALAEFDHVVLEALRETQTALTRYAEDLRRVEALRAARDSAKVAAEDEARLYRTGRQPYLSSLDAQRSLDGAEIALAGAEAQVSQDQVRLFLALGGGWQNGTTAGPAKPKVAAENHPD